MISSANNLHQKHAKLARPAVGEWGRNELSILGTDCHAIRQLSYQIIQSLPAYNIGYADADHAGAEADTQSVSAIRAGAFAEYINKISFARWNTSKQLNPFQKRALFTDCDLILVNGNHFTAARQIIVIDEAKPLEKKLDKLTAVQLILVKDSATKIPDFIHNHLSYFSAIPVLLFDDTEAICNHIKHIIQQQIPLVNGLVLCGGNSTRMGRDKGDIQYHNKPQKEYLYELLQEHCEDTFFSCNGKQAQVMKNLPVIEDTFIGLGATGGILSAFQHNPNVAWLAVACDLPFLNKDTIAYLINHRNSSKTATSFWDSEGKFPEPLVTIWEPKAYPFLLQLISEGWSCPRKALLNSDVELLQAPDAAVFANINTPDEHRNTMQKLSKK